VLVVHSNILPMDEPFSTLDVLTAETQRTDSFDPWEEGRLPIKGAISRKPRCATASLCSRPGGDGRPEPDTFVVVETEP
jgi:hypothetical protein